MKSLFKRVGLSGRAKIASTSGARRGKGATGAEAGGLADEQRENAKRLLEMLGNRNAPSSGHSDPELREVAAKLVARIEQERRKGDVGQSAGHKTLKRSEPERAAKAEPKADGLNGVSKSGRPLAPSHRRHAKTNGDAATNTAGVSFASVVQRQNEAQLPTTVQAQTAYASGNQHLPVPEQTFSNMVRESERLGELEREHPATIAGALKGRDRKQQAKILRRMPGSVARTVQRLLI